MREHNKLRAFQLADEVALLMYRITRDFPKEEVYGLTSQMRRAGVSIASNIVEGCARQTQTEYRRFLDISYGSLKELHYQFSIAVRLDYVQEKLVNECDHKLIETEKVLAALIRTMR